MKASETKLNPMIEGTKQYVVPLFQRAYSWGSEEWNVLWNDLIDMLNVDEAPDHFMGSVVTMPMLSVPEGVTKYLLIDGQQRLTTLFVLLVLLRDMARPLQLAELADEIHNTLLTNPYKRDADHVKLLPTQVDRASFLALVNSQKHHDDSNIYKCYQYFERKMRSTHMGSEQLRMIFRVIARRLSLVSIVLEHDDNPYLVFESLNAKGKPLSQADLIRNYFFMRIHVDKQDAVYRDYWYPMQLALGEAMTEFVRHFLMRDGRFVKESDVYVVLKSRVTAENALVYLEELRFHAQLYERIIYPDREPDVRIRRRLQAIAPLEATIIYPFVLSCFAEYAQRAISLDVFAGTLDIIENFFIRRYLCNYRREGLNRELPKLHRQIHEQHAGNYLDGLPRIFQLRGYPSNEELKIAIISLRIYGQGSRLALTRHILERIERSFDHHEEADISRATIEHVMPQTLTDWWRQHLGNEWETVHAEKLHVLGNLTLSAYNQPLSNKSFVEKQKIFADSHIVMNRYFTQVTRWQADDIDARSLAMAERAIQVWPDLRVNTDILTSHALSEVTHTKPFELRIQNTVLPVRHWNDVLHQLLKYLYTHVDADVYAEILRRYSTTIWQRPGVVYGGGTFEEVFETHYNMSARDIYRCCYAILTLCDIGTDEFEVKRMSTR